MRALIDFVKDTKDLLKVTARQLISQNEFESRLDKHHIFKAAYQVLAESLCSELASIGKFVVVTPNAAGSGMTEVRAEFYVINKEELYALLLKTFENGQKEAMRSSSLVGMGLRTLSTAEIEAIEKAAYDKGKYDASRAE